MTRSFRSFLSLTLIFSFVLLPALFSEEEQPDDQGEFRAILIGIADYKSWPEEDNFASLKYCVKDIVAIAEILKKNGYKDENITVVKEETVGRESFPATKSRIMSKITDEIVRCKKNDVLLIYFSGHGIHMDDQNYLVPYDGKYISQDQTDEERSTRKETLINVFSIYDLLANNCEAKTKYFITDACQKNILASNKGTDQEEKSHFRISAKDVPAGMIQLSSCSTGESSFEQNGHGLFSAALIEGIQDKADANGDGQITITELFHYVSKEVPKLAESQFGKPQNPSMESRMSGEIVFAYNPQKIKANELKRSSEKLLEEARKESSEEDKESKLTTAWEKLTEAQKIWPGGEYNYLEREIQGELAGLTGIQVKKLAGEAWKLYKSGDYEKALEKINEALEQDSENLSNKAIKELIVTAEEMANAAPANPASDFRYTKSDGEVTITKLKNENFEGEVVFPSMIDGLPVTSIGVCACPACNGLTSVTIPESVTSIGESAFQYCDNLTSVKIPGSVTSIGVCAFLECKNLTSVTIPGSVTSIGKGAFLKCKNLTSVTIQEGVTSIGEEAFFGCVGLTTVTIPESVTSIGVYTFQGCSGLTSIEVASGNAYYQGIDGVLFTKDGKTIHCYPDGKKGSSYRIPEGVTSIGDQAFSWCKNLTSVTIPGSVTSIGESAFLGCDNLTSLTIPENVTSIGEEAFAQCDGLTSLTIPESVTSIGKRAFGSCKNLMSLTIPASVTSIGESAFSQCGGLTSVTILEGVTSIGDWAFSSCKNLTLVTIPASVTSIGVYPFSSCKNLTIRTPEGSAAEKYAKEHYIKYETTASSAR